MGTAPLTPPEIPSLEVPTGRAKTRRVFPRGTLFRRPGRPGWWVNYVDPRTGRRVRRDLGPDRADAQAAAAKIRTEIREHAFFEPRRATSARWPEAVAAYLKWAETNKISWRKDEQYLRRLGGTFGGRLLSEISPAAIEGYKAARVKDAVPHPGRRPRLVSTGTINHELACLKHFFSLAVRWGLADSNPVKSVDLFRPTPGRTVYLTPDQVRALLEVCTGRLRAMVTLAVHTGMRKGEILGLKWDDVDEVARTVRILRAKNGESRHVPLNAPALAAIRGAYGERHIETGSPFLFCRADGRPYQDCHHGYRAALARAGLGDRGFTFHTLRHTAASLMARAGVPILAVKDILGHKTIGMTLRYAHLFPDQRHDAVHRLEEVLGGAAGPGIGTNSAPVPRSAC